MLFITGQMLYHPDSFVITYLAFCTYFMVYFLRYTWFYKYNFNKRKKRRENDSGILYIYPFHINASSS